MGRGREESEGKGTGNKKHKWQVQNRHVKVKNSVGNREAKEFICMTHEQELRGGGEGCWWEGGVQGRGE